MPKISAKLKQGHPQQGTTCRWGRLKLATFELWHCTKLQSLCTWSWVITLKRRPFKRFQLSLVANLSHWVSTFVCSIFAITLWVTRVHQRQLILVVICSCSFYASSDCSIHSLAEHHVRQPNLDLAFYVCVTVCYFSVYWCSFVVLGLISSVPC